MNLWEEYKEARDGFRKEYDVVANQWRFLQSARLIFLGIIVTAEAALLGGFGTSLNFFYQVGLKALVGAFLIRLIPAIGMFLSLLAIATEKILESLISSATLRGRRLEHYLAIPDGIFSGIGIRTGTTSIRWLTIPRITTSGFIAFFIAWLMMGIMALVVTQIQ